MKVVLEREAQADAREIAQFYEKGEVGAGLYFYKQLRLEVAQLRMEAGIHGKRFGFHFCQIKSFPVGLYYKSEQDSMRICAVMDCRRNPSKIQKILRKR